MRLTLRTLLAWLDDTLPPAEVRQIGQQVNETPLAQELVQKIQRVTRQRRLTVPTDHGHDALDPNVVAEYLGDSLSPELVTEYEKKCLTSDVHLAEVASVHQILSLLAQKAKVPPEARQRMYHLLKRREPVAPASAATPAPASAATPAPASAATPAPARVLPPPRPEPVAAHVPAYVPPALPRRSLAERYGPLAAVVGLIALLCWSAWMSVGPAAGPAGGGLAAIPPAPPQDAPIRPAPPIDLPADPKPEPAPEKPEPEATPPKADATKDAKPEVGKPSELPAGAAGAVGPGEGVLLRDNAESRSWERLLAGAALRDGDRVVNLPPFRAGMRVGTADVTIVGDGEVAVLAPGAGASGRFSLNRGRVRIVGSAAAEPIVVPFEGALVKLTVPAGAVAGLERLLTRFPGEKAPAPAALRIWSAEGTVTAEADSETEALAAGTSTVFRAPKSFAARAEEPTPAWLAAPAPGASEQDRAGRLARYFKGDRSPIGYLVEAAEDEREEVRRDAVTGLGALVPLTLDLIVATLSKKDDPASRKAAIAVLRDVARRSTDSAKALRGELERLGGSKLWADTVENLLVGPSTREAADEAAQAKLVALLKHEDVGVRELAIDTLQAVYRRADRLGYDPDKPADGNGVKAWQDLVQRHELKVPAAPKAK